MVTVDTNSGTTTSIWQSSAFSIELTSTALSKLVTLTTSNSSESLDMLMWAINLRNGCKQANNANRFTNSKVIVVTFSVIPVPPSS